MFGPMYHLLPYTAMTLTQRVVSYFEAHPQENEIVCGQFVYPRTVHIVVHLCLPLNTECIQHRSLLVTSLMLIIKARRLGLCTRNSSETIEELGYKSQRLADYFSSTNSIN